MSIPLFSSFVRGLFLWLHLVALSFFLYSGVEVEHSAKQENTKIEYICPKSLSEWKKLRDSIHNVKSSEEFESVLLEISYCYENDAKKKFAENKEFVACMADLLSYIAYLTIPITSENELLIDKIKDEHLIPNELNADALMDFKKSAVDLETLRKKIPSAKIYQFESQYPDVHGKNFFVFRYTDKNGTRLLNVDLGDASTPPIINGALFKSKEGNKVQTEFFRYEPKYQKEKKIYLLSDYSVHRGSETQASCGVCHINGYLKIFPKSTEHPEEVKQLNKDFSGNWTTAMSETSALKSWSDISDSESSQSRNDILNKCYPKGDTESKKRVLNAMSCTDCHSRDSKANVLKTPDLELGAIKYYILMGTMPPLTAKNKVQLSLKEREVLVDCLMIEHLGNLYKTEKKTDGAFVSGTLIKSLLKKECPN